MQVLRRRNSTLERMLGEEQAARTTREHEVGLCLPQGFAPCAVMAPLRRE